MVISVVANRKVNGVDMPKFLKLRQLMSIQLLLMQLLFPKTRTVMAVTIMMKMILCLVQLQNQREMGVTIMMKMIFFWFSHRIRGMFSNR